jgi:hypothetical protein
VDLKALMIAATAACCWAQIALADSTDWRLGETGKLGQACYDRGDWACAFDNIIAVYEDEFDNGGTCDFDDQGCGFSVLLLYDLSIKASAGVEPARRRQVSERFLTLMTNVKVSEKRNLFEALQLGTHALQLEACIALDDDTCRAESAAKVVALVDKLSPTSLDEMVKSAVMSGDFPLDLQLTIADARQMTEGSEP